MIHDPCSLDHCIEILNEIIELDPDAARSLVETRVPCNAALAKHPEVQVVSYDGAVEDSKRCYSVGLLGVLNGIFGTTENGWGKIAAEFDVVCPECKEVNPEGQTVYGKCPKCGGPLALGNLTAFHRLNNLEHMKHKNKDTKELYGPVE